MSAAPQSEPPIPAPQAVAATAMASQPEMVSAPQASAPAPAIEPVQTAPVSPTGPAVVSAGPDLRAAVESWANAWSARNADLYLSAYGMEFLPADGAARDQWEQSRRTRLQQSSFIKVGVSDLKIVEHGPEHAQVSFDQHYESDAFSDDVRKTLIMKKVGADWKIVEETVR